MSQTLNADEIFARFERDGFRLRNPAQPSELHRLQRSIAAGDCLNPVIIEGDELFVAPTSEIEPGDLTLVRWTDEIIEAWMKGPARDEWERRHGVHDMSRGVKIAWTYTHFDGYVSRYWVCKDIVNMGKSAMAEGRVVAVRRQGVLLTGDLVHRAPLRLCS